MKLSFRQVHLDFHTSECIDGIGSAFSKEQFQAMLKEGHLSSITVFSKCHHGWAYHPSKANQIHPGLKFDLLGAQIEAAHEIGVKTPTYTAKDGFETAGVSFSTSALNVATANNGIDGAAGTAVTGNITVTPTGSLPEGTKDAVIGTITITIS